MTRKQRQTHHRHLKQHTFKGHGGLDFTDFSSVPQQMEKLIDSGEMVGALTFYKLKPKTDKPRIGMMAGGITIEETFDTICAIRRSMMERLGFIDMSAPTMADAVQEMTEESLAERAKNGGVPVNDHRADAGGDEATGE